MTHAAPRSSRRFSLVLLAVGVLGVGGCDDRKPGLPDYGTVPEWDFVDETGGKIGTATLAGRPWAVNFIFTKCRSACPRIAASTKRLQGRMQAWLPKEGQPTAQLVSISVDPVTDTPERLSDFSKGFGADPRIWKFARGEYSKMEALVTKGFLQALERSDHGKPHAQRIEDPTPIDTAHSVHFVLIDGRSHIRGFYGVDEDSLSRLDDALRTLARSSAR